MMARPGPGRHGLHVARPESLARRGLRAEGHSMPSPASELGDTDNCVCEVTFCLQYDVDMPCGQEEI